MAVYGDASPLNGDFTADRAVRLIFQPGEDSHYSASFYPVLAGNVDSFQSHGQMHHDRFWLHPDIRRLATGTLLAAR
jgi:hypothetical protein